MSITSPNWNRLWVLALAHPKTRTGKGIQKMLGTIHIIFAVVALLLGAAVILRPKGGRRHRTLGYLYALSLLILNACALLVYEDWANAGPFHILAVVSLATLTGGFIPAILRRPASRWLEMHAYFMSWSYVGLVAAGVAQLTTMVFTLPAQFAAGVPSALVVIIGGVLLHTRVPKILFAFAPGGHRPLNQNSVVTSASPMRSKSSETPR
ncbi:DUF2306 domain-containing protein [Marinimicrobium locisalis]|uniref:DUF2306 domain-containing protein n=1 Tax=Marinimicrobium locisalis TaxID=546022 RepID=UPI003221B467